MAGEIFYTVLLQRRKRRLCESNLGLACASTAVETGKWLVYEGSVRCVVMPIYPLRSILFPGLSSHSGDRAANAQI